MIVYRLLEGIHLQFEYFDKGDIISAETLQRIMLDYYEVRVVVVRIQ